MCYTVLYCKVVYIVGQVEMVFFDGEIRFISWKSAQNNNNKNINFVSPVISSVIKNEIDGAVRNISQVLFKLAVEESLLTEVLAWYANVAPDNIDEIRELCKYKVATTHGNISFEEARKKYY